MAHTYKDQLKYKAKHFHWTLSRLPVREDPWKKFPWYKVPRNQPKQFWRTALWRSYRSKVRKQMHRGNYDNLPLRPDRYAWIID